MPYDETLARRVREALRGRTGLTERRMFGGLAFLLDGRMCCGILGDDLVVRVTDDEMQALRDGRYVRPMDFTGTPMRGFVYVSPPGFRTKAALDAWLDRGVRFVRQTGPGRAKRARRPSTGRSRSRG